MKSISNTLNLIATTLEQLESNDKNSSSGIMLLLKRVNLNASFLKDLRSNIDEVTEDQIFLTLTLVICVSLIIVVAGVAVSWRYVKLFRRLKKVKIVKTTA